MLDIYLAVQLVASKVDLLVASLVVQSVEKKVVYLAEYKKDDGEGNQ